MAPSPFFQAVPTWTPQQVRDFLQDLSPEEYTLLDVRQEDEYAEGHLPGATLIPLGELPERLHELDSACPTIVYGRSGGRGSTAAGILLNADFSYVWNMGGGIMAWNGQTPRGTPEAGRAYFDGARSLADHVALAWVLEEGARRFYTAMAHQYEDDSLEILFRSLARGEEAHKATLRTAWRDSLGEPGDPELPAGLEHDIMEGGVALTHALEWAADRPAIDVLEFAMAAEATAFDRYLLVASHATDAPVSDLLARMAKEEKLHLDRLTEALEAQRPA